MGPKIVRMSTHGDVREFALPKQSHDPAPLIVGPDGNLWFLEDDGHVGRITLTGEVRRFPAFEPTNPAFNVIIAGPDGNLWFSAQPGKIGCITPSGAVTLFPLPPKAQIGGLAAGSDGRVWFLRSDTDTSGIYWWTQIGRITP